MPQGLEVQVLSRALMLLKTSERKDGNMGFVKDLNNSEVIANRQKFLSQFNIDSSQLILTQQVHGDRIAFISKKDGGQYVAETDALVTTEHNLFLGILTADCLPVFFYEEKKKITAIAHCGWRGIIQNLAFKVLNKTVEAGGNLENLKIFIGPGIQKCHFEIKEDVLDNFKKWPENIIYENGKIFIDLLKITKSQLAQAGLATNQIESDSSCTFCLKEKYFSYRREGRVGNMISVIGAGFG